MKQRVVQELARQMRERRERIFAEVARTENDLRLMAAETESELEDRAEEEREAHLLRQLDDRGKQEIEQIDDALLRISAGSYGRCQRCGGTITVARLTALPEARTCIECARDEETIRGRPAV